VNEARVLPEIPLINLGAKHDDLYVIRAIKEKIELHMD
jgi:hypothetical protein